MPKKRPKLALLAEQIAVARRISDQQALLGKLRVSGEPTREAEGALRTYISSLMHLIAYQERLRLESEAKRGETKKGH